MFEQNKKYSLGDYPVSKSYIGTGFNSIDNTVKKMIEIIKESSTNPRILSLARTIVQHVPEKDQWAEVDALYRWQKDHTRYIRDPDGMEMLQSPLVALDLIDKGFVFNGDCFSGDTHIIVRNKKNNQYCIKKLIQLEKCWDEYEALSYNFEKEEFEFKRIINFIHKKGKQTYEVKPVGKRPFSCTDTHEFFTYEGQNKETKKIHKRQLKDIDLTRWWKKQLLSAREIPMLQSVFLNENDAYIKGIYSAEGFSDAGHTRIAQNKKEIVKKIRSALNNLKIPFSESRTDQSNGGYFNIKSSTLKEELKHCGENSSNKKLPDEILSGDKATILNAIEGYRDGDAFIPTKGQWLGKVRSIYNTSSDELARQLEVLHLVMGKPLTVEYQKNHMGCGKKPIWRLYDFIRRHKQNETNIKHLNTVGIKSIKKDKIQDVYCITVKDNHNIVLSNGIIASNCDDLTLLLLSLIKSIGYPVAIRIAGYKNDGHFTHVYGLVKMYGEWFPVEPIRKDYLLGQEAPNSTQVLDYEVV